MESGPTDPFRLFDQFIGGRKECFWHFDAERCGGREIDDKLEFRRCLHRQISRLLALEDAVDITSHKSIPVIAGGAVRNGMSLLLSAPCAALIAPEPRIGGGYGRLIWSSLVGTWQITNQLFFDANEPVHTMGDHPDTAAACRFFPRVTLICVSARLPPELAVPKLPGAAGRRRGRVQQSRTVSHSKW
jgi:hypothetical protein